MSNIEEIRRTVAANMHRVAELGQWPSRINVEQSLLGRIPKPYEEAPGFDAGIACALDLIPRDKQQLAAQLHANYTPEAVKLVRRESVQMHADAPTTWWLAACWLCDEDGVRQRDFLRQVFAFKRIAADPKTRRKVAREELERKKKLFVVLNGIAYGAEDGAAQGAYIAGVDLAVVWMEAYGIYFVSTYHESLGLEDFAWSDRVDDQGRPMSGPVHGSRQFVKTSSQEELGKMLEIAKAHLAIG